MDFSIYDLKDFFTLEEAALAWVGMDKPGLYNQGPSEIVFRALVEAAQSGELPVKEVKDKYCETDWRRSVVSKSDLVAYAKKRSKYPKFLFPEQRGYDEGNPIWEGKRKLRPEQESKQLVQAIAQTVWYEDPERLPENLIHHPVLLEIGGGVHYGERKRLEWIREVDPKNLDHKPGPKRKRKKVDAGSEE